MPSNLSPELAAKLSPSTVDLIRRTEEWLDGNTPGTINVVFEGVFEAVVCTSLSDADVDERMAVRPCTGSHALVWGRDPDYQPAACQREASRRHIVYTVLDRA